MVSAMKNRVCGRGTLTDVVAFILYVLLVIAAVAVCFLGVPWLALVSWNFFAAVAGGSALIVPVTWKSVMGLALIFAALRLAFWPLRRRKAA